MKHRLSKGRSYGTTGWTGGGGGEDPTLDAYDTAPARIIREHWGMGGQLQRLDMNYANPSDKNPEAFCKMVAEMGGTFVRGRWSNNKTTGAPTTQATAMYNACKKYNLGWLMSVTEEGDNATSNTQAETKINCESIITHSKDVCIGIEGINEPNHNRAGSGDEPSAPVPENWANITMDHQKIIANTIRAAEGTDHITILSPSLHDTEVDHSAGEHWTRLVDLGLMDYCDAVGMHTYAGQGNYPLYKLNKRVGYVDAAFGTGYPIWATEWGYSNAYMHTTSGHAIIRPETGTPYIPRGILQLTAGQWIQGQTLEFTNARSIKLAYFEGLDQYASNSPSNILTAVEDAFGIIEVGQASLADSRDATKWKLKPGGVAAKNLLASLADGAGASTTYTSTKMRIKVDTGGVTDIQWLPVSFADGTQKLYLWRNVLMADLKYPHTVRTVATKTVKVRDKNQTQEFQVGGDVTWIDIAA